MSRSPLLYPVEKFSKRMAKKKANWLSVLEFALRRMVRRLPDHEVRAEALEISNRLLDVNAELALLIVGWIDQEMPEICAGWKNNFYRRYGERRAKSSLILMS
jgi:hypothetical protein